MSEENKDKTPPHQNPDQAAKGDRHDADARDQATTPLPAIDFSTFVISLNSSALVQLGILE
jgi:hypothetical protein